jgi:hypothetical protein
MWQVQAWVAPAGSWCHPLRVAERLAYETPVDGMSSGFYHARFVFQDYFAHFDDRQESST